MTRFRKGLSEHSWLDAAQSKATRTLLVARKEDAGPVSPMMNQLGPALTNHFEAFRPYVLPVIIQEILMRSRYLQCKIQFPFRQYSNPIFPWQIFCDVQEDIHLPLHCQLGHVRGFCHQSQGQPNCFGYIASASSANFVDPCYEIAVCVPHSLPVSVCRLAGAHSGTSSETAAVIWFILYTAVS